MSNIWLYLLLSQAKKNYEDDLRRTAVQIIYSTKLTLKETSIGKFLKLLSKYTMDINMPNILLFLHLYAIAEETVLEKVLRKHALSKIARRKECSAWVDRHFLVATFTCIYQPRKSKWLAAGSNCPDHLWYRASDTKLMLLKVRTEQFFNLFNVYT